MPTPISAIEILAQHARGEIEHLNAGLCPDSIEGSLTRDAECPVCQALQALEGKHSGEPRVTVALSLGKAQALGLLSLQPGVHAICEGDLTENEPLPINEGLVTSAANQLIYSLWVRLDACAKPMLGTVRVDQPTYERWEDHGWVMLSNRPQATPAFIQEIAQRVATQDNRATAEPIFAVMQKREMVTLEGHDHDRIVWVNTECGDYTEASRQKARHLEKKFRNDDETPGWARYAVKEVDQFVTACFSEEGCKDYLRRDRHNLRKPFIYAFGSYRNAEWHNIIKFFTMINQGQAL